MRRVALEDYPRLFRKACCRQRLIRLMIKRLMPIKLPPSAFPVSEGLIRKKRILTFAGRTR